MIEPLEELDDLSPSAKLVYKILEYEGSMTQSELAEDAMLDPRAIRRVTSSLEDVGLVDSRHSQQDGREIVYSVSKSDN